MVALAVLAAAGLTGTVVLALALRRSRGELQQAIAAEAAIAQAEQEHQVEQAVSAERTRILREMHDVIAHSLSIMIAQADGGSYVTADPDATRRALLTIADTGRVALADTRRILGILRDGGGGPELSPVPQQSGVAELVEDARDAGVEVRFVRLGAPRRLPSAVGLALYRICQEALTNVMKHAPAARVVITENWLANEVVLTVTDSGDPDHPTACDNRGLGLIGMRERAEVVGGFCEAGPQEIGGFRVRAVLPSLNDDALAQTEEEDD